MNTRYHWLHKSHSQRSQRRRRSDDPSLDGFPTPQDVTTDMEEELASPIIHDYKQFEESDSLMSLHSQGIQHGNEGGLHFQPNPVNNRATISPQGLDSDISGNGLGIFPHFAPPVRNDTAWTNMSTDSVRSLKNRLSLKSTFYAKQVTVLMKKLTIGSTVDLGTPQPDRGPSSLQREYTIGQTPTSTGTLPQAGLAVPGDFLLAPQYQVVCRQGKHHGAVCWCEICDIVTDSPDNFFLTVEGDLCGRGHDVYNRIIDPVCADQFGNTPLHLFAALAGRPGQEYTLKLAMSNRVDLVAATNKADQTFLHVLDDDWFIDLHDPSAPLYRLLEFLRNVCPHLVYRSDVYGRTIYHRLHQFIHEYQVFNWITQQCNWMLISRDAFDVKPAPKTHDTVFSPPQRMGTIPLSPLAEEDAQDDGFAARHQGLLSIVTTAWQAKDLQTALVEDGLGRNGLHCLAELNLTPDSPNPNQSPSSPKGAVPRGSLKRKHGSDDANGETPVARRLGLLEGLLLTKVDVNHYDKRGNTVLIAFVENLLEEHDDKSRTIAKILDMLIDKVTNIDARNRRGETALLVAARCGHKIALRKLLERGANVHARDKDGLGIIALIDAQISQSPSDLPIYGRLEACRAVMAKQLEEKGVQPEPSTLDEWGGF